MPRREQTKRTGAIRAGRHPTAYDLEMMRLGYPGYQDRLQGMKPERRAAVMAKEKTYVDLSWVCSECHGSVRYTQNLRCHACCSGSVRQHLRELPTGERVYVSPDEAASERYQERRQRNLWQLECERVLRCIPDTQTPLYSFRRGRIERAGCIRLEALELMQMVAALESGDAATAAAAMRPLLDEHRELAVLVRHIAQAVQERSTRRLKSNSR